MTNKNSSAAVFRRSHSASHGKSVVNRYISNERTRQDDLPAPAIRLIPPTAKRWPKSFSVRAMPAQDRQLLAMYLGLIHPDCTKGTEEGLFGVANILYRAGLSFTDLGKVVYDQTEEDRIAA